LSYVFQIKGSDKWLLALGLAQAGEFGFVLLSFTVANHVIPADIADLLLLVVALSMLLTPMLFIIYDKVVAPRYACKEEYEADEIDTESHIIIAGHGRFGGVVNRALSAAGFETTVVDYSSEQLALLRSFKLPVYFGDATRPDLLHAAGIDQAKLLVIAMDEKESITHLARYVIENHPDVHIVARAIDRIHVYELWSIGCRDIIRENYDSSIRAGRSALQALGFDQEQATTMMSSFEDIDRRWMLELADLYDADIPVTENKPFMARYENTVDDWKRELKDKMSPSNG
jgi:CPA2 family monovalent cation:H+ antiporter-2